MFVCFEFWILFVCALLCCLLPALYAVVVLFGCWVLVSLIFLILGRIFACFDWCCCVGYCVIVLTDCLWLIIVLRVCLLHLFVVWYDCVLFYYFACILDGTGLLFVLWFLCLSCCVNCYYLCLVCVLIFLNVVFLLW